MIRAAISHTLGFFLNRPSNSLSEALNARCVDVIGCCRQSDWHVMPPWADRERWQSGRGGGWFSARCAPWIPAVLSVPRSNLY